MTPKFSKAEQIKIIGKNIDRLLYNNRINQADLAKILNVSESAVGKWVLGKNAPSMGNIQKIADYFSVSMSSILEEQSENANSTHRKYLLDKIAKGTPEQLRKLDRLWDIIVEEDENNT